MLHSAILPHHTKWFQLFEQLRIIVIDELHTYRGVFGSHVANVLRRLLRICAHYGSHPVIVCCSATIGNPGELAATLTGRPTRVVDRTGAPAGRAPRPAGRSAGRRARERRPRLGRDPGAALGPAVPAGRAARPSSSAGRASPVELLLTGLRESLRESYGPRSRVRGYRGGYLPTERRSIEHGLRDGEILGVVATNALELGVDIGRLDASILAGYPGSVAGDLAAVRPGRPSAGHQRRGARRVGRAGRPVRDPPPGVPARGHARGGPARPGQPARPAGAPAGGDVRAAVRPGRGLRARSGGRPARVPRPRRPMSARPTTAAGTGRARTSRRRRSPCGRRRPRTS